MTLFPKVLLSLLLQHKGRAGSGRRRREQHPNTLPGDRSVHACYAFVSCHLSKLEAEGGGGDSQLMLSFYSEMNWRKHDRRQSRLRRSRTENIAAHTAAAAAAAEVAAEAEAVPAPAAAAAESRVINCANLAFH